MKKVLKFTVLISLTVALLTGCGSAADNLGGDTTDMGTSTPSNVSLRMWGAEDDAELLGIICDNFKAKYPEVTFDFSIEAQAESDCRDSLLGNVGNAPDVFTFVDDQFAAFCASGILKPINNSDIASRNSSSSVAAATMKGELYAYPLTADNGYFLFYNSKYLSPEDVTSFDALLDKAEELGKTVTFDMTSGWYGYAFFGNTGLTVGLNDDGISNFCTWNDTANDIKGVDVAKGMLDLAARPGFVAGNDSVLVEGAKDDSVIAGVSGVWLTTSLQEAWGNNLSAAKLPTYTCGNKQVQLASYAGYKLVGVNSYSENYEWASKFADYLTSEECQTLRFKMRQQGPSNINAANSSDVQANVGIQALIAQSDYSSLQRIGNSYWGPMADFGTTMSQGNPNNQDLQELLDKLVTEITKSN